jgi:hypothetical protein
MSLHDWLGRHVADPEANHWDRGQFVSRCTLCGRTMIKPPGLDWRLGGAEA